MRKPNRVRLLVLGAVTVSLLAIPASYVWGSHSFPDVSGSAFYHDSVAAVKNAGITSGYPDGTYRPNNAVTRGEMAVFLDLLGGLTLGPGGQPNPVVDALSVQGTQAYRFVDREVNKVSGTNSSLCSHFTTLPVAAAFGSYSIIHRLYSTPVDTNPADFNVQLRDDTGSGYDLCVATLDGSTLPNGSYKTYGTEMVFHGQNTFSN